MSASVKFTKVSHNPSNNKSISFTQELGIGTVIYIKDNTTAIQCIKDETNTFKKIDNTYTLPQNHGLTLNTYYVVIKNPCADESTKDFFICETSAAKPIPAKKPSSGLTSSGAELLENFKLPQNPIQIKIYRLEQIQNKADLRKLTSKSINLIDILNIQISKQKDILRIAEGDTKSAEKTELSRGLYKLYNAWITYVYNELMKEENKPGKILGVQNNKQPVLLKMLDTMRNNFSSVAFKLLTNEKIAEILRKNKLNNFYTGRNLSTIYNQLYNDENYLKINFIYLEQINNLFCLHAIDKGVLTPETAKQYFSKLQISTLDRKNTENNNLINIFSYKKKLDPVTVYDKYYLKGVDKSIREEYGEEKVKSLPETDEGEVYNVTLKNITMTGGSTKKRHMKSRTQSKKTKKNNRK